jgi:cysteine-rich repeat protein
MMDVSGFNWNWRSDNTEYAAVYGSANAPTTQVSALANTVGIGLNNPDDGVNVVAVASTGTVSFAGKSPLTIDLSDPSVVEYWPKCLEACTNAEVAVRFNTTMSLRNLPGTIDGGSVQLLKCTDENCLSTISVLNLNDISLDPTSNYSVLKIANSLSSSQLLEPNTLYKVVLSASSTAGSAATNQLWSAAKINDPQTSSKPFNKEFTWRFRTKKDQCQVDRAVVNPPQFFGTSINEKTVYSVQPYASPDACSSQGQKINPWTVSWNWSALDPRVATVTSFNTKGNNPACTASCIRKGSDVPAGQVNLVSVCGNGKVEAGEDCDGPDSAKGCTLKCLFAGNTAATCGNGIVESNIGEACDPKDPKSATGCSLSCRHVGSTAVVKAADTNASICGNAGIGSGEDCDTGIAKSVGNPLSALNCSEKCLHTGSRLSKQWCLDNQLTRGGFSGAEYTAACSQSFSQCGDGIATPDEDAGCDVAGTGWNSTACTQFCLKKTSTECVPGTEGCDPNGRHIGSSLLYSAPSSCGDGTVGTGEDDVCESSLTITHDGLIDPWTLATGVGLGVPSGNPAAQTTLVKAATIQNNRSVGAAGVFSVACGYNSDIECKRTFGNDFAVGENSCCYRKPGLISTYPANNAATVCPNTYLEAVFDSKIDENTLKDNVLVARGSATACVTGQQDVTALVAKVESRVATVWYKNIFGSLVAAVKSLFFGDEAAAVGTGVAVWCTGQDAGVAHVMPVAGSPTSTSRISITISAPLALNTDYAVILKEGVKDVNGVSIGKVATKNISWHFATADKICEIKKVTVNPSEWSFSAAGATTTVEAAAYTATNARVQPIANFYDWQYLWGPENPYVSFQSGNTNTNVITAQNRNGEIDVRAEANLITNKYTSATGVVANGSSHVIVFLCENPWPPKSLYIDGQGPFTIFPYQDKAGNNDAFDLTQNAFTNKAIPASSVVADGYFNFGTYYCADNGSVGTFDDLPYLRPTVQTSGSGVSATGALKKFFFTNDKNADAIGVQIFANPKHLSPADWYALGKSSGGQGFVGNTQNIQVDGYSAITDGSNIYVDALNYSPMTKNIYSTIYLFSINANATPESKKVFEAFVTNLKFNTNVSNYGYCGTSIDNPGFQATCQSDLDCPANQICSASVAKLKRNYERLRDLNSFQTALASYADKHDKKFPTIQDGSYLTGQTVSTWPSWSDLGNTLGTSVPADPINQLSTAGTCSISTNKFCTVDKDCGGTETCVLHDPVTAWSVADRRFSFACPPASYAYRYTALPAGADYTVRAKFEDTGLTIANQDMFMADFIDPKKFITGSASGICNQDQEISSLNGGVCGDGVVNTVRGEQCDPVGQKRYGVCSAAQAGKIKVDVCDANCHWAAADTAFVDCSFLSKCGNGAVEAGEACDDGKLNGRYNHCTAKCALPTKDDPGFCGDGFVQAKYEVCDTRAMMDGKPGICVDGNRAGQPCSVAIDCNVMGAEKVSFAGVCKKVDEVKVKYAQTKSASCNWDCQSTGPYCGDGIVQSDWGEECDGATSACTVGAATGGRSCSAACKWTDSVAAAWWRFDDAYAKDNKMTFAAAAGNGSGVCDASQNECPEFTASGKFKGAFVFKDGNFITVPHTNNFDTTDLTLEAWIRLTPGTNEGWKNILLKQNGLNAGETEKDYNFSYYNTDKIVKLGFSSPMRLGKAEVVLPTPLAAGEWHHVAVTVANTTSHFMKFYVDGKPIAEGSMSMSDAGTIGSPADRNYPIYLGGGGGLDELKVYKRVLQPAEIANEATDPWFCSAALAVALGDGPRCGDSKVDAGEACDKGAANGQSCTPAYGKTCSYCASDCKNIVDVQTKAYCGDGVVQGAPFGNEVCDLDQVTKSMYLLNASPITENTLNTAHGGYKVLACSTQPQDDYTQKKEIAAPSCGVSCSAPTNNCVTCGVDAIKGVEINGSLINVTDPTNQNVLLGSKQGFYSPASQSKIDVYIGLDTNPKKLVGRRYWEDVSDSTYALKDPATDPITSTKLVKLNSYSLCSSGDPRYTVRLNGDTTHRFDFPVFAATALEQYDLVLSPVINNQVRPNDIRVVVSWVKDASFYGGFTVPLAGKGKIEGTTFAGKLSTGPKYYDAPARINGVGYHGFGSTQNKTSEEAFFINTEAKPYLATFVSEMNNDQYAFYVRTDGAGIGKYRNTSKLKVDVYFPENDPAPNHFATPAMTFYLNSATPSDNPNANYWHVFNVKRAAFPVADAIAGRIIPVNKILTESKF